MDLGLPKMQSISLPLSCDIYHNYVHLPLVHVISIVTWHCLFMRFNFNLVSLKYILLTS